MEQTIRAKIAVAGWVVRYAAQYSRGTERRRTQYYQTPEAAQDALMALTGEPWPYLGRCCGDAREDGQPCMCAPRAGGQVDIITRRQI